MKCFFCSTMVPTGALVANFCVACGRPITQPCPYEAAARQPGDPPTFRLTLRNANGRATSACPNCKGLFKVCSVCHRLNELDCVTCRTGCEGATLREPIPSYPSSAGLFDGTRAATWNGNWDALSGRSPKPLVVETLQGLAFRYGRLVGATRRDLLCWSWEADGWEQIGIQPLTNSGELTLASLCMEQGRVFALSADRALVYSLAGGLNKPREELGAFAYQAVNVRWWTRVGADGRLLITDCETWTMRDMRLPEEAGKVSAVASDTAFVYLATENGFLFQLNPEDAKLTVLGRYNLRWVRIAVQEGRFTALGFDLKNAGNGMSLLTQVVGGTPSSCSLGAGTVPDFAWLGDSIYVAQDFSATSHASPGKTVLSRFSARQITTAPHSVTISGGAAITAPGMLAMAGLQGDTRVLLRQLTNQVQQWITVDPETGSQAVMELKPERVFANLTGDMDGWPRDAPLVCMADTRLIIAAQEQGKTAMRTYSTLETP